MRHKSNEVLLLLLLLLKHLTYQIEYSSYPGPKGHTPNKLTRSGMYTRYTSSAGIMTPCYIILTAIKKKNSIGSAPPKTKTTHRQYSARQYWRIWPQKNKLSYPWYYIKKAPPKHVGAVPVVLKGAHVLARNFEPDVRNPFRVRTQLKLGINL